MNKQNTAIFAAAAVLAISTAASQASLSLSISNQGLSTGIQFNGASSSFQLDPAPGSLGSPQFTVTSETGGNSSVGLNGWINGSPWAIGAVTTTGTLQTAAVTGLGSLFLSDGQGHDLTGNLNWMTVQTDQSAGFFNASLLVNISKLTYAGANADLLALANSGNGSMNVTFQFNPGETLSQLVTGSDQIGSYSGAISMPAVPEPSTILAGSLLLLPLGVSTFRILRKRRNA